MRMNYTTRYPPNAVFFVIQLIIPAPLVFFFWATLIDQDLSWRFSMKQLLNSICVDRGAEQSLKTEDFYVFKEVALLPLDGDIERCQRMKKFFGLVVVTKYEMVFANENVHICVSFSLSLS